MERDRPEMLVPRRRRRAAVGRAMTPARTLFLAMFAGQASFLVLAPILPEMSREFGVATATAGQLRLVSGAAGGVVALTLAPLARRVDLRSLLSVGLALLASGSFATALAPTFSVVAAAQLALGAGLGIVVSAALVAAAEWEAPERRARTVSWALLGQPAAWVAGMPVAGAVAGVDWRLAWLAVPFLTALVGIVAVRGRPADTSAAGLGAGWHHIFRQPAVAAWAFGELLAVAAWGGTLVFSGALFIDSYGASTATVGVVLAAGATAYFPGSFLVRRNLDDAARPLLIGLALALAVGVAAFGTVRPGVVFSAALFALLVFLAGGRTLAGSAIGLDAAPAHKMAIASMRAAATQFGYLLGAGVAGVALAAGGYPALGLTQAAMFTAAALGPILIAAHESRPTHSPEGASLVAERGMSVIDAKLWRGAGTVPEIEFLQAVYAEWGRGNFRFRTGPYADGFAWGWSDEFPGLAGVFRDPASASRRLLEWLRQWKGWTVEAEDYRTVGDFVVVICRYRGSGSASGVEIDARGAHLWTMGDGEAVRLEIFSSPERALAAAGLEPVADGVVRTSESSPSGRLPAAATAA